MPITRADRIGAHRTEFDKNRRKIIAAQDVCGICGKPVDKSLKWPHPLSACVDHIIPIDRGGHPSAMDNLQLAHMTCNRQKSDKILHSRGDIGGSGGGSGGGSWTAQGEELSNRVLPQSTDWTKYRS